MLLKKMRKNAKYEKMKRRTNSLVSSISAVALVFTLGFFIPACGEKSIAEKDVESTPAQQKSTETEFETIIVGKWQMTAFNIIDPNAGSMALDYAREVSSTVKYTFRANGEYELTSKTVETPKTGTWKKGPQKNQVIIQMGNEPKMLLTLEKQEENHLWCRTQTPRRGDVTFQLLRIEE